MRRQRPRFMRERAVTEKTPAVTPRRGERGEEVQVVGITAEVEAMAATFMATGALPPTMRPDALHLAAATLS
ncbi:MAG: hypothetical protein NTZ94_01345 [Verrucomicrobia bacterium]|nr:hypothetical protein [Verrucomicrobiota bacterium]